MLCVKPNLVHTPFSLVEPETSYTYTTYPGSLNVVSESAEIPVEGDEAVLGQKAVPVCLYAHFLCCVKEDIHSAQQDVAFG